MLAGIPLTFALCFDASAVDQEVQRTSATANMVDLLSAFVDGGKGC